jgi:hypothetical protein
MDTDQLLVARLADLRQELTEALREARQGSTSLRGSVERIHGLFASLSSDEDVKHAISTLSRDTSQVVAHAPALDMQALEARLADVLKSTDKYPYPPPPSEVEAVHQALQGLDNILRRPTADSDLDVEVLNAVELLTYKLRELLNRWDDDPAMASEVAGKALPKILSAVTTLGVAIGIDQAKPQVVEGILESGIVDRMVAQTVAAVVLGAIGQRIVVATKEASDRVAIRSDMTMKRDLVEIRGSRVVQDAEMISIRLKSSSDSAALQKKAQILLTDIRLFENSRDGFLDQISSKQAEKIHNSTFSQQVSKIRIIVDDALRIPEEQFGTGIKELTNRIDSKSLSHNWGIDSKQLRRIKGK